MPIHDRSRSGSTPSLPWMLLGIALQLMLVVPFGMLKLGARFRSDSETRGPKATR